MKHFRIVLLSLILFPACLFLLPATTNASTFVVKSTGSQDDDSPGDGTCHTAVNTCTLRAAITEANSHSGADVIHFNIGSGGQQTITPAFSLPEITEALTIDATSQPGCTKYPCIVVNGASAGPAGVGISISAGNTTIKGLIINGFSNQGIFIKTNGSNTIVGNFIGTNAGGTLKNPNYIGLEITNGSSNNIIGGTSASLRNVISGNGGDGIWITGSTTTGNTIIGNFIGLDITGKHKLANSGNGILMNSSSSGNHIGGTATGERNKIAFNGENGIAIGFAATENATRNSILGNSIYNNALLGIDLGFDGVTANDSMDSDTGANNLQNFPVITSAVSSTHKISGTLNSTPNTTFTLEFFSSKSCDASGYGEGKSFRGRTMVTTDGAGNAPFTFTASSFKSGRRIKSTATDPNGNTSEFSQCVTAS